MATFSLGLAFDGTAGTSTFTDVAGNSITVSGGATLVEDAAGSGGIAGDFNALDKYLSIPGSTAFVLPGDFSIGVSFTPASLSYGVVLFVSGGYSIEYDTSGNLSFTSSKGNLSLGTVSVGNRYTVLITRDATGTARAFKDGVKTDEVSAYDGDMAYSSSSVAVGGSSSAYIKYLGTIDDLFIVNGQALHVADYTPSLGLPEIEPDPVAGNGLSLPIRIQIAEPFYLSCGLSVSVSDPRVFDTANGHVKWSARVIVAGNDVSSYLTGAINIEAEEDAARTASLSFIATSPEVVTGCESASVTIDLVFNGGGYSASIRRFTGVVETVNYSVGERVISLQCRDGYQERIKACKTASAVRALLGGMDTVSDKIALWNEDSPDPVRYFRDCLETLPGCTFIDGSGLWSIKRWNIGAPSITYMASDMFDPGPSLNLAQRASLPSEIVATLTHTFPRLHNAEIALSWSMADDEDVELKGLPYPTKAMIRSALDGLDGWTVKGAPLFTQPVPSESLTMTDEQAAASAKTMYAVCYRRWYQYIEREYTVTISMVGTSERDDSISHGIQSEFEVSDWENGKRSEPSLGIYSQNPPYTDTPDPTGYEALSEPWPPTNGAMDEFGDLSESQIQNAVSHVVAKAMRKAAEGRRGQTVTFSRPTDLRIDIGSVAAISAYGVSATGQLIAFSESMDFDTGEAVGDYTFACPAGNSTETSYSASITFTAPTVVHEFPGQTMLTHIGGDDTTIPVWTQPDYFTGFLCNTQSFRDSADTSAPYYETQFRLVMPEIPETVRDPVHETVSIDASITIAGDGVTLTF